MTPEKDETAPRQESFRQYRRTQIAEMADWTPAFDMTGVSVSEADKAFGSPQTGDKIARNPANHADRWLVAAAYFAVNFELIDPAPAPGPGASEKDDLLEAAWGVIANAGEGSWERESKNWQIAATAWRDRWHKLIADVSVPPPVGVETREAEPEDVGFLERPAPSPSTADVNDGGPGQAAYCHHRHHPDEHSSDFDTCPHPICLGAREAKAEWAALLECRERARELYEAVRAAWPTNGITEAMTRYAMAEVEADKLGQ